MFLDDFRKAIGTCDSEVLMHLDKSIISLYEEGS